VIALMVWLYWTSFFMLVGAEFELPVGKRRAREKSNRTKDPSGLTGLDLAA